MSVIERLSYLPIIQGRLTYLPITFGDSGVHLGGLIPRSQERRRHGWALPETAADDFQDFRLRKPLLL